MKNRLARSGVLALTLALSACADGGIPDHGKVIDQARPRADYPAAPTLQQLLKPANLSETGIAIDPAVTAYPQRIIDRLLGGWPGPHPVANVYLVPVEDFTSDVSAGGAIFLNAGLIQYFHDHAEVQSEDAFAFVLAHELSHILLGHTVARQQNAEIKNVATNAMKWGALIGGRIAGASTSGAQASLSTMWVKILADTALFPSWTRGQEEAADTLAIDLMSKAGYSVDKALATLQALVAEDKRDQDRKAAAAASGNGPTSFHIDNFTLNAKKGDALDAYVVDSLNGLTQEHPHAAERLATSSQYINREYADRDIIQLTTQPFLAWVDSRPVTSFLRQSTALEHAAEAVGAGNWTAAHQILAHVGAPLDDSQYWIFLSVLTDSRLGRRDQAAHRLQAAAQRDDVTLPVATSWGDVLSQAGQARQAEDYMAAQQKAFDDRSFLEHRIANAKRSKDGAILDTLMVECVASGDDGLQDKCASADK